MTDELLCNLTNEDIYALIGCLDILEKNTGLLNPRDIGRVQHLTKKLMEMVD